MNRIARVLMVGCAVLAGTGATCRSMAGAPGVSRAQAIEIARAHVTFTVAAVRAEPLIEQGRRLWRVVFQGQPYGPDLPGLYPTLIVLIDRNTGEVVSIAKT